MKTIKILGLTTGFLISVLSLTAFLIPHKIPAKKTLTKTDEKGFAVLELFTSEGCSSCPPADELLAKIQLDTKGKAIYLLAYHVDYWNRQGWKDSFSSAEFSNRQIQYGRWLGKPQIYTPQVIVNGRAEYIGSNELELRAAIFTSLAARSATTLALQAHQTGEKLGVQYQTGEANQDSQLLFAIVQKTAQSKVERGENAGRTLSHVQIVRKLQSTRLGAGGTGSSTITLPKDFNTQNWEVLGLIQDQHTGEILAAAKVDLNAEKQDR